MSSECVVCLEEITPVDARALRELFACACHGCIHATPCLIDLTRLSGRLRLRCPTCRNPPSPAFLGELREKDIVINVAPSPPAANRGVEEAEAEETERERIERLTLRDGGRLALFVTVFTLLWWIAGWALVIHNGNQHSTWTAVHKCGFLSLLWLVGLCVTLYWLVPEYPYCVTFVAGLGSMCGCALIIADAVIVLRDYPDLTAHDQWPFVVVAGIIPGFVTLEIAVLLVMVVLSCCGCCLQGCRNVCHFHERQRQQREMDLAH